MKEKAYPKYLRSEEGEKIYNRKHTFRKINLIGFKTVSKRIKPLKAGGRRKELNEQ